MTTVSRADVETTLKGYVDPYLEKDLIAAKCVKTIRTEDGRVEVEVELGFPATGYREVLSAALHDRLAALPGVVEVTVRVESKIVSHEVQRGLKPLPGVKNVIAVAGVPAYFVKGALNQVFLVHGLLQLVGHELAATGTGHGRDHGTGRRA